MKKIFLLIILIFTIKISAQQKFYSGTTTNTYIADTISNYRNIIISNDSTNSLQYSFDSTTTTGIIKSNESLTLLNIYNSNKIIIWIRSYNTGLATAFRIFAW